MEILPSPALSMSLALHLVLYHMPTSEIPRVGSMTAPTTPMLSPDFPHLHSALQKMVRQENRCRSLSLRRAKEHLRREGNLKFSHQRQKAQWRLRHCKGGTSFQGSFHSSLPSIGGWKIRDPSQHSILIRNTNSHTLQLRWKHKASV